MAIKRNPKPPKKEEERPDPFKFERTPEQRKEAERKIQEALRSTTLGSDVAKRPILTTIIDKITILANMYGIDGAADLLGIDIDYLNAVLQGRKVLTRREIAKLEIAYNNLLIEEEHGDIDFDNVERYARNLQQAIIYVNEEKYVGERYKNSFRYAVANEQLSLEEDLNDKVQTPGFSLFAQGLDAGHRARINEFIEAGNDLSDMFDAYRKDIEEKGTIWWQRGDEEFNESYWWEWFRETFYS